MPSSISTVRLVGVPSSSIDNDPRRAASVPSSTTVTPLAATCRPMSPAKADVFMQHHARPAGPEHDIHFAGRCRNRFEVDQCLADRAVGGLAPSLGVDET